MNILITGAAGFIGMHTSLFFLKKKFKIYGIDNLNDYYDPILKKDRLKELKKNKNFVFKKLDLVDKKNLKKFVKDKKINFVIHLAAQAGVRYSLTNPNKYIESNILGFQNLLDICKDLKIKNIFYASSSSVYGNNKKFPFKEKHITNQPKNLYASTKLFNENLAHSFYDLYNLNLTGLRFFTVYGPWGRPDMALFIFTKSILAKKKINVFNSGKMIRDFTYIDDIVSSIYLLFKKRNSKKNLAHEIYNIGYGKPCNLLSFITEIEKNIKKKAKMKFEKMQLGDVKKTYADTTKLVRFIKRKPKYSYKVGVKLFCKWFLKYYKHA